MHPGPDPLGAPPSFAARRPNAPNHFELPPPSLANVQKYSFAPYSQASQPSGSVASVGNLLTPPTNLPGDGLSPSLGATTASASQHTAAPYTPNGYAWSSPHHQGAQYGFQAGAPQPNYSSHRPLFSPSLNLQQRQGNSHSPATSEGMQAPHYEVNLPPFPASGPPMSAPATMPSIPSQQHHYSNTHPPVSSAPPHPSPIHSQEGFPGPKPPPTPTYYTSQPSSTPQQTYPYSTGPSPTQPQPSPLGGPAMTTRMSPVSAGPVPSMSAPPSQSPHYQQRPFGQYPLPGGPVLSNINNPNGGLAVVGMPHNMMHGFNSGHAASMQHMYGSSHPPPQQPPNDRPFRCDQCPQSFNRNHDLKRHKRIHLAVKPFPCGHCDKSFSRKDALKRHILVKGCGKAQAAAEGEKQSQEGTLSPDAKGTAAESSDHKPVVSTS